MNFKEFIKLYKNDKIVKVKIGDIECKMIKEFDSSLYNTFYTNERISYEKLTFMIASFNDIRDKVEFGETRLGFYRRFCFKNNKLAITIYYIKK